MGYYSNPALAQPFVIVCLRFPLLYDVIYLLNHARERANIVMSVDIIDSILTNK